MSINVKLIVSYTYILYVSLCHFVIEHFAHPNAQLCLLFVVSRIIDYCTKPYINYWRISIAMVGTHDFWKPMISTGVI